MVKNHDLVCHLKRRYQQSCACMALKACDQRVEFCLHSCMQMSAQVGQPPNQSSLYGALVWILALLLTLKEGMAASRVFTRDACGDRSPHTSWMFVTAVPSC